jgi:hypothetical protein
MRRKRRNLLPFLLSLITYHLEAVLKSPKGMKIIAVGKRRCTSIRSATLGIGQTSIPTL